MFKRFQQWYCFTDDETGPFRFVQVVRMYANGDLLKGDMVRLKGTSTWQRIEQTPQFVSAARRYRVQKRRRDAILQLTRTSHPIQLVVMGGFLLAAILLSAFILGHFYGRLIWKRQSEPAGDCPHTTACYHGQLYRNILSESRG